MNFTLNGRTVTVEGLGYTGGVGIAVSVDGVHVGYRPTMAQALTLATVATAGTWSRDVCAASAR